MDINEKTTAITTVINNFNDRTFDDQDDTVLAIARALKSFIVDAGDAEAVVEFFLKELTS